MTERIAVVGAGAAGLVAAITLAEAGRSVVLFESRQRVGGRIFPVGTTAPGVELGAEFLHGRHPALMRWVERAGLSVDRMDGRMLRCAGTLLEVEDDGEREAEFDILSHLPADEQNDLSFADWLRSSKAAANAEELRAYVEGFNAADAEVISCAALVRQQDAEEKIGSEENYRIRGGYAPLLDWLRQHCESLGVELRLGVRVEQIEWQRGSAALLSSSGKEGFAKIVCAVPLPILQQNKLQISPLPQRIREAMGALVMGDAARISVIFRERFWETRGAKGMSFLFTGSGVSNVRVFWTLAPDKSPVITAWVGGPRATKFAAADDLYSAALHALARCFRMSEAEVRALAVRSCFHDWKQDNNSLGAYSYVRAGGLPASRGFSEPVEDTLFFAGEHTDTEGHWGTVHAAVASGERAARQVLESR